MNKMDKLQDLLKLLHDSLTREEFIASFKLVIDAVQKAKSELSAQINTKTQDALAELDKLNTIYQETIQKIQDDNTSSLSNIKKWALEKVGALYVNSGLEKKIDNRLNEMQSIVERKIAQIKAIDTSTIALEASKLASNELLSLIPSKIALEEEIPKFGENIVDALELLQDDERLDKSAIKGLQEELDRIIAMIGKNTSFGGTVNRGTRVYGEVYTATDGQTDFNTLYPFVNGTLQVCRGGSRQNPSGNYTISGQTVSFTIPLQAGEEVLFDYER